MHKKCEAWFLFKEKLVEIKHLTPDCNEHRMSVLVVSCAEAKNPAVCRAFSNSGLFHRDILLC